MSDKNKTPISELMEQAMKNYDQALQASLKVQEEYCKWWSDFMTQTTANSDWQKGWKTTANQTIPIVQKRMEESLRLVEQSSRTSLELLKQTMAVSESDSPGTAQTKLQELWKVSLEALRTNARAVSQANSNFVESWQQLFAVGTEPDAARSKAK